MCTQRRVALDKVKDKVFTGTQEYNIWKHNSEQYQDLFCNLTNTVQILFSNGGVLKQTTTSLLVDTETLISNIGGGLGLALGISAYSVVAPTLEWVFRRREARQESKRGIEGS